MISQSFYRVAHLIFPVKFGESVNVSFKFSRNSFPYRSRSYDIERILYKSRAKRLIPAGATMIIKRVSVQSVRGKNDTYTFFFFLLYFVFNSLKIQNVIIFFWNFSRNSNVRVWTRGVLSECCI